MGAITGIVTAWPEDRLGKILKAAPAVALALPAAALGCYMGAEPSGSVAHGVIGALVGVTVFGGLGLLGGHANEYWQDSMRRPKPAAVFFFFG